MFFKAKSVLYKFKLEIIVFALFVLIRAPDLGHDIFNTDVWKWKSRSYNFSTGVFSLNFEQTIQKYHPGVTLMWLGTAGIKLFNLYYDIFVGVPPLDNDIPTIFALHTVQKYLIVLATSLTFAFLFYGLKKLYGSKYALIAAILMLTEPLYVALTRVMHLEGLMTTFMWASVIWYFMYLTFKKRHQLVLSAIFTALAVLTKSSALFLIPYIGLITLIDVYSKRVKEAQGAKQLQGTKQLDNCKNIVKAFTQKYMQWFLFAVLGFFIFWPAMLVVPGEALNELGRGIFSIGVDTEHIQLFLGKWVDNPGIIFYPLVIFYRTSVLIFLGLVLFLLTCKKTITDSTKRTSVLYLALFLLFYLIELSIPAKKLDRYIIPVVVGIVLLVSYYFEYAAGYLEKIKKIPFWVFLLVIFIVRLGCLYLLHPNYLSYYSPLGGGLAKGIYVIEPKWMIGQKEIINFLQTNEKMLQYERFDESTSFDAIVNKVSLKDSLVVGFPEKYYTQVWPFIMEIGGRATVKDITANAVHTNIFIYPVYDDTSVNEDRFDLEFVDTIKLRGVPLYNVYVKQR